MEWSNWTSSTAHHSSGYTDSGRALVSGILSSAQTKGINDVLVVIRYVAMAIALPLTLINVVVFRQKDMRTAASVYVIGISLGQLAYVVIIAMQSIFFATFSDPMNDFFYWSFNLYFGSYGVSTVRRGAYLVTCLLLLEKLYAVLRPLHVKLFFLSRRPVFSVMAAFLCSAAVHTYIVAKSTVVEIKLPGSGKVVYKPGATSLYLRHKAANDAVSLAAKCVLSYGTLCAQIALNVMTIWSLKRHNVSKGRVTSSNTAAANDVKERRERQMTVTVLAATVSYAALSLPWAVHNLLFTVTPHLYSMAGRYRNLYILLSFATLNLTIFSCAIDFICFITLSSAYKTALYRLLGIKSGSDKGRHKPAE